MSIVILSTFFITIFLLIIFGLTVQPRHKNINILPVKTNVVATSCIREKVQCTSDSDCFVNCTESAEGEEMVCQALPDISSLTKTQMKMFGFSGDKSNVQPAKYCVPGKAKMDCNIATGGIPVFTGWSGSDSMDFECMCSYPLWASSRVCNSDTGICTGNCMLNPDICKGGTFNWDLTKKIEEPLASLCTCQEGDVMVVDPAGLPRCVPKGQDNFYNDIDISTGTSSSLQPKIAIGVPSTKTLGRACPQSTSQKQTDCKGDCCPLPGAVCCGNGTCCPSGYTCDAKNSRCVKAGTCEGTTCPNGGCCPFKNGVCTEDSCCPPNYPNPDPTLPYCNPNLKQLSEGQCVSGNQTTCIGGCCPYTDGVCCGDGKTCCPPDYPICDMNLKVCRKSN